jgi:PIN domain nuclease of toxin-antitoxin system
VLDAYAVLAYLRAERCADEVAALLRAPSVLTAANAAEVLDQLVRVYHPDDVHMQTSHFWRTSECL